MPRKAIEWIYVKLFGKFSTLVSKKKERNTLWDNNKNRGHSRHGCFLKAKHSSHSSIWDFWTFAKIVFLKHFEKLISRPNYLFCCLFRSSEVFIICRWICHQFGTLEKPAFCWLKGRSDHKVCTKSPTSITFLVCCRHGPFLSCWEIESGWFTKPNLPPLPPRIFFWKVRSWRSLPEEGPPPLLSC